MPEIELTESQLTDLDAIRDDLEAAFVDTYGHVRRGDVVNYLLDTYTPPDEQAAGGQYDLIEDAEYPELQHIAAEVPGIPGSGINADEMRGRLLSELGAGELASRLEESTAPAEPADDESAGEATTEAGTSSESSEGEANTRPETDAGDEPADESADATGGSNDDSSGSPAGGGILASANQLLEEHDDKWRKDDTNDEPFSVTLPDGTTESVRTRDDVRKLLFQHY